MLEKPIQRRFNTQGMPLYNACIQMPVASSLRIPLSAVTCPEDPAFISLGPTWNMPIEWRALDCLAKCKSATMDHIQCYRFYMCFGSRLFCENIWEAVSWFNIFQIFWLGTKLVFLWFFEAFPSVHESDLNDFKIILIKPMTLFWVM